MSRCSNFIYGLFGGSVVATIATAGYWINKSTGFFSEAEQSVDSTFRSSFSISNVQASVELDNRQLNPIFNFSFPLSQIPLKESFQSIFTMFNTLTVGNIATAGVCVINSLTILILLYKIRELEKKNRREVFPQQDPIQSVEIRVRRRGR